MKKIYKMVPFDKDDLNGYVGVDEWPWNDLECSEKDYLRRKEIYEKAKADKNNKLRFIIRSHVNRYLHKIESSFKIIDYHDISLLQDGYYYFSDAVVNFFMIMNPQEIVLRVEFEAAPITNICDPEAWTVNWLGSDKSTSKQIMNCYKKEKQKLDCLVWYICQVNQQIVNGRYRSHIE